MLLRVSSHLQQQFHGEKVTQDCLLDLVPHELQAIHGLLECPAVLGSQPPERVRLTKRPVYEQIIPSTTQGSRSVDLREQTEHTTRERWNNDDNAHHPLCSTTRSSYMYPKECLDKNTT